MARWLVAGAIFACLQGADGAPLAGQQLIPADHGPRMASREQLTAVIDSLQLTLSDYKVGSDEHVATQRSIQAIADRLRGGDVHPGDVVQLRVSGEDRWTSDHTVTPLQNLALEAIDPVDVSDVLYSELEEKISLQLARYLRDPRVEVLVLKRIGVTGFVARPGFYTIDGSSLVSDAVMLAGGPGSGSNVSTIQFRRMGVPLAIPPGVVWQSMSLDDLGVQSGDEMYVPQSGSAFFRFLLVALGVVLTITLISIRIF
ncbi:MAG: polysaccharide biosynthesis/export family protein [Gemmatimonadota bacterium]